MSTLKQCSSAIRDDTLTYGIACTKDLLEFQEITVEYDTDITRIKKEAQHVLGTWALLNATVFTMETGHFETDLVRGAVIVVKDGVIHSISKHEDAVIPENAVIVDGHGCELMFTLHSKSKSDDLG